MILSIDVGLRNLAMCIMDSTDKTDLKTYCIHLWDVYNTLDEDTYLCQGIQKNGKICNKKCGYTYLKQVEIEDSECLKEYISIYSCKNHFPKDIPIKKKNIYKKKAVDNYLLQDIGNFY